ncbi:MAG: hypothetical protein AAF234_08395 [Pseudomonadota bacterium]
MAQLSRIFLSAISPIILLGLSGLSFPAVLHAQTLVSSTTECVPDGMGGGRLYSVATFSDGSVDRTFLGTCTLTSSSSTMDRIKHSSAGSLIRPGIRVSDRLAVSGLAWGNQVVQDGQARQDDDDDSGIESTFFNPNANFALGYAPTQEAGFHRPFAAVDRAVRDTSSAFSTVGGVRFSTPRFDGVTTDINVRHISVDSPFVDTDVADFQSDTFITYSLASRLQVQAGLLNSYSRVEVEGGGELDVWRSEIYGGGFAGVLPWLWLDGSVGLGFADFDANTAANTVDETSLLFSTSGGATVIAAHPDWPWAASGRVGVNFLHVGTSPDEVNQTKLDLTARIGRRMDWGPGGGAAYVGYIGSTALANAAVPGQDWTNQIEAGVIFALPNLGVLRLSGDVLVGDADVENYAAKLTFHLFPNRS